MGLFPKSGLYDALAEAERFADENPQLAQHLGASTADPSLTQLRNALFFLGATVRDQARKAQTEGGYQAWAELIAPSLLRPFPAATILELSIADGHVHVPAGAEVRLRTDDVRFRLAGSINVGAFRLGTARPIHDPESGHEGLRFMVIATGDMPLSQVVKGTLRIYVDGPRESALLLLAHVLGHTARTHVTAHARTRQAEAVSAWGIDPNHGLAPEPDGPPTGVDLLREYFVFYEKFLFFQIDVGDAFGESAREAEVTIWFDAPLPARASQCSLRANCIPAVNIFRARAEPQIVAPETSEYPIRVAGISHEAAGVYCVLRAAATPRKGRVESIAIPPRRRSGAMPVSNAFPYTISTRTMESDEGSEPELVAQLARPSGSDPTLESYVVGLELLATNRDAASKLRSGDELIPLDGGQCPGHVAIRAVVATSPYLPVPTRSAVAQNVIARGAIPAGDALDALQIILLSLLPDEAIDASLHRANTARIRSLEQLRVDETLDHRNVRRGYLASLVVDEEPWAGLGDLALFIRLLCIALDQQAQVNRFYRCAAQCTRSGARVAWPLDGSAFCLEDRPSIAAVPLANGSRVDAAEDDDAAPITAREPSASMRPALLEYIRKNACRFGFYRLVELLEYVLDVDVTRLDDAQGERLMFEHVTALHTPASDVAWVHIEGEGDNTRVHVGITFLGLIGVASPLTPEWTEEVTHADDESAPRAVYDVFLHRAVAMLYSAKRAQTLESPFFQAVAGFDPLIPWPDDPLPAVVATSLADYQHGRAKSIDRTAAERLLRLLRPQWDIRLTTNVQQTIEIRTEHAARLDGPRTRLGVDAICDETSEDGSNLVRIRVGPVDSETYESLMPGGAAHAALLDLVDRILGETLEQELDVLVCADAAYSGLLDAVHGARLGVNARYSDDREELLIVRVRRNSEGRSFVPLSNLGEVLA